MSSFVSIPADFAQDLAVHRIATETGLHPHAVIGGLFVIWSVIASQGYGEDTQLDVSYDEIDGIVGVPGFATAMANAYIVGKTCDDNGNEILEFYGFLPVRENQVWGGGKA